MTDFIFHCPHCGQSIKAEDDWIGQKATCPTCGGTIVIAPEQKPVSNIRHEDFYNQSSSEESYCNTLQPSVINNTKPQSPVFYQQNVLSSDNANNFWKIAVFCSLFLLLGIFILMIWPKRWEYKVLECKGEIKSYSSDEFKPRPFDKDSIASSLNSGFTDWELVTTITEIETLHPNFGQSGYVTGIQPNTRTTKTLLVFRRRKFF